MLINGREMNLESGITVKELLKELKLDCEKVVVEVNMEIVGRDRYEDAVLDSGDRVEIVSFVGGG